jgi:hypothetical protein
MRKSWLLLGVLLLAASVASAQMKMIGTTLCAPVHSSYQVAIGDHPGHAWGLAQGKCTWTKPWEIAGVKNTEGTGTQKQDINGDTMKVHGIFVDTMANGDKAFYNFQFTGVSKNDGMHVTDHKWELTGGTGKLKGVKGHGTCNATPVAGGSTNYVCEGEYTLAK